MVEDQGGQQGPLTVHVHVSGKVEPEVVAVDETILVREMLVGFDGHLAWIEEAAEPLEMEVTLSAAGVGQGAHLHRGSCREVEVTVTADGRGATGRFPPPTRAATVTAWAAGEVGLADWFVRLRGRRSGQRPGRGPDDAPGFDSGA